MTKLKKMIQAIVKNFRDSSIKVKISIMLIIVAFTPIIIIGFTSYYISRSIVEENTIKSTHYNLELANNEMENELYEIEDISLILLSDYDLQILLDQNTVINNRLAREDRVRSLLDKYVATNAKINSIAILDAEEYLKYHDRRDRLLVLNNFEKIRNSSVFKDVKALGGKPLWVNIGETADDISLIRVINKVGTRQKLGFIMIDIDKSILGNISRTVNTPEDGNIIIKDKTNNIIFSKYDENKNIIDNFLNIKKSAGYEFVNIDGNEYFLIYNTSNYTDWLVGVYLPIDYVFSTSEMIKNITMVVIIISIVISIMWMFVISDFITKPIKEIRSLMGKVERGNLSVRFNSKYNDEFGQLGNSFNKMLSEMRGLIEEIYESQLKIRKNELKSLQMQINPHFLYNTLDTINWMAQNAKQYEIARVSRALANYFRLSLSKGKQVISIGDELRQLENYLIIQKTRYQDLINVEIEAEDEIKSCKIIKLTLQPIVENAIYHGIKEKGSKGNIFITAKLRENSIIFKIKDDGIGMKPEELDELIRSVEMTRTKGFGLSNVNERIKLYFGNQYGISIQSKYGVGTEVTVIIPKIKEGDLDENFDS
ncbi:MAG: sensor histidine kinase [Clostridia bacterium]|nr:sensor histidine kinase [Clostridia bacterium]